MKAALDTSISRLLGKQLIAVEATRRLLVVGEGDEVEGASGKKTFEQGKFCNGERQVRSR